RAPRRSDMTTDERILDAAGVRRYADAIVKRSLGVCTGDFLLVRGRPEQREIVVATAEAGYRAGAKIVDVSYYDPLVERAHFEHGSTEAPRGVNPTSAAR